MKRTIPLESATKAELIAAIKREFGLSDVQDRIERQILDLRVESLLAEMKAACDEMQANCQTGESIDPVKRERWSNANDRWNRAHKELSKLQDT